jgi:type II secretory pathway pseudopilin PulG
VIIGIALLVVGGLAIGLARRIVEARKEARRCAAAGGLSRMRLALRNYQNQHGHLPPLCLYDENGEPTQSWRALILPHIEFDALDHLDVSEPWDSEGNRKVIAGVPPREWDFFARLDQREGEPPATYLFALLGEDSIWDPKTGQPKGKMEDHPRSILLTSVPRSDVPPLKPGDITESEVRRLVEDGQEVLFMKACVPHNYGIVRIEDGELVYRTWSEERQLNRRQQ